MTKKQKEKHLENILNTVKGYGFVVDRWGNHVLKKEHVIFRIKNMKNNIRFEYKKNTPKAVWFKIFSDPIIRIDLDKFNEHLNKRILK
jgi:hypothetical protein